MPNPKPQITWAWFVPRKVLLVFIYLCHCVLLIHSGYYVPSWCKFNYNLLASNRTCDLISVVVHYRPSWSAGVVVLRRAWLRGPSPSTADLEKKKRKKTFLYRRNQQPPSCRGSELGFRSNTVFYWEIEHPYLDMTASFPWKRNLIVVWDVFCEKNRELDRRSSDRKAPYIWFPLQSAALQPLSPFGAVLFTVGKRRPRPWLSDNFAKIQHFYAIVYFYGASHDFCMKKFDVTQNGFSEHLKITTLAWNATIDLNIFG